MIRRFLPLALAATLLFGACANDDTATTSDGANATTAEVTAVDANTMKIAIPTMQCETCAKTITKAVEKVPGVEGVKVEVDSKTAFVQASNTDPAMRQKVESAISEAGYTTENMQRNQTAYDELPDCCKDGGM